MTVPRSASTGRVVILNGVSRAGKSTLARAIQESVPGQDVVDAVELAQRATHAHRDYDLEVDTSVMSPGECAVVIARRLVEGPRGTVLAAIAALGRGSAT